MTEKRVDGFFYGLFMDPEILRDSGVVPDNPRAARIEDYALVIGNRATLMSQAGARAFGMVYALSHRELDILYNAPGLEAYRPEAVLAQGLDGRSYPALCYNLLEAPGPKEANPQYAEKLRSALRKLDFPEDYIKEVK